MNLLYSETHERMSIWALHYLYIHKGLLSKQTYILTIKILIISVASMVLVLTERKEPRLLSTNQTLSDKGDVLPRL